MDARPSSKPVATYFITTPLYTIPVCVIRDLDGMHLDVHLAPKHQILNPELPPHPHPFLSWHDSDDLQLGVHFLLRQAAGRDRCRLYG